MQADTHIFLEDAIGKPLEAKLLNRLHAWLCNFEFWHTSLRTRTVRANDNDVGRATPSGHSRRGEGGLGFFFLTLFDLPFLS